MTFVLTFIKIAPMKKLSLIFCLVVLIVSSVYAESPWAINSVKLGLGNDKYAYGLSRNDDDQLSYSEHITLSGERWYLKANLDGITNRGWKTGWNISDSSVIDEDASHFRSGRLDVTEIIFGLNYRFDFNSIFSLKLSPETGFFLSGYTGYDTLQNLIHKINKIHRVDLPYDYEDVRFHYYLGAKVEGEVDIAKLDSSELSLTVGASFYHAFGFETNEKVNGKLSFNNGYNDIISVTAGWNWRQEHNSSYTMELYSKYISTPYAAYSIDTGLFYLDYWTQIGNHFGYAVLSFDVMSFFYPTLWKENDIFMSMGFCKMMGLKFCDQELNYPINEYVSIVFKNRYVAGYPIDQASEFDADLSRVTRIKQGHTMNTLGVELSYPIKALKDWVTPYVAFGLGFMRWDITMLTNMQDYNLTPSFTIGVGNGGNGPDYSFVADVEAGLTLLPEDLIAFRSTSISISAFVGLSYVTGDHVSNYRRLAVSKGDLSAFYDGESKSNFMFRWGFSLNFGFDI